MPEFWLSRATEWHAHATCRRMVAKAFPQDRQYVANLWFPVGADCEGPDAAEAMSHCNGVPGERAACPVRAECLEANVDQKHGIFGGTTPRQRERIRINRKRRELWARKRVLV